MAERLCIGNDIVALPAFPLHAPRYQRVLRKIMTVDEISEGESMPRELMLPLYFSCKESAYKHFVKKGLRHAFCPRLYRVGIRQTSDSSQLNSLFFSGSVTYNDLSCAVSAEIVPGKYVHSCCFSLSKNLNYNTFINCIVPSTDPSQSSGLVRNEMIRKLRELKYHKADIEIFNDPSSLIPTVRINGQFTTEDFSMSHDGRWIAGVLTENPCPDA